ncbi:MAG: hypothetical protein PHV11_09820 [Candidatus Bipolaricaulis sp.]|jgi:hypothetical protein|nr:hypothetical protein [Candidatus Bipolaricaulis sp.]
MDDGIRVRRSREFKLKKNGQNVQVVHMKDFGFTPEVLIIERVRSSWFTVSAVLTPEQIKKEDKLLKKKK